MLSVKDVMVPMVVTVAFLVIVSFSGCTGLSSSTDDPGGTRDATSARVGEPKDPSNLVNEAWSLNAQGRFREASDLIDQAAALDPSAPGVAFNRGWALTGLGRYNEALTALDQALAQNQDSAISWSNKGYALAHLGRCEEAKKAYTRAHDLEPSNLAIRQHLDSIGQLCTNAMTPLPTTRPSISTPAKSTTTMAPTQPTGSSSPAGQLTRSYSDNRFSLNYPASWNAQKSAQGSTSYDIVLLNSDSNGIVWIYGGKTDTSMTLDDLQASQMASWAKYTDFYLVSREKTTLAENPAIATTYTWTDSDGNKQETYAVVAVIGKRAYIGYFSKSPPSSYLTSLPVGKSIIDSLQVSQPVLPASATAVPATSQLIQSYRDNRISLKYPVGWTYKTDATGLAGYDEVTFNSPGNTLLVVFYGDKTETLLTLDDIQASQMDALKNKHTDFRLLSTEKTTVAGSPAVGSTYTWTSPKGDPQETYLVVSIIDGRRWYVYYVTDPGSYQANLAVAKSVIGSFIPLSDRTVTTS